MGSAIAGSGALQAPQRPTSARCLAGIRFGFPQAGQFLTFAIAFLFFMSYNDTLEMRLEGFRCDLYHFLVCQSSTPSHQPQAADSTGEKHVLALAYNFSSKAHN
jgi:hypothetical protein